MANIGKSTSEVADVEFFQQVADFLANARRFAKQQVDSVIVVSYYEVGRMIVEREQQGKARAEYGTKLIAGLSDYLTAQYGKGHPSTVCTCPTKPYCNKSWLNGPQNSRKTQLIPEVAKRFCLIT
jgi:hypothetical protein